MPRNSGISNQTLRPFKAVERRLASGQQLLTTPKTSNRMATIRQSGTAPELQVRRTLSALGYRYRLRNRDLPGSPDLANRSRKWAVFVHGCYWHHHANCPRATIPKTNPEFWRAKFAANRIRDASAKRALQNKGYRVATMWECECQSLAVRKLIVERLKVH
jgi:DNA mismatch endonuclease (patch repair protein)